MAPRLAANIPLWNGLSWASTVLLAPRTLFWDPRTAHSTLLISLNHFSSLPQSSTPHPPQKIQMKWKKTTTVRSLTATAHCLVLTSFFSYFLLLWWISMTKATHRRKFVWAHKFRGIRVHRVSEPGSKWQVSGRSRKLGAYILCCLY